MATFNENVRPRSDNASPTALSARQQIVKKTLGEVRTFVDEVANGTTSYRTIHSLTEQIEHQYHDRFVMELLQNAHDALLADRAGANRRVAFRIDSSIGEHGALLVANDGQPFRYENFLALARLGQSSKDFRESVGNKGLGFRSVLQISAAPEIYSRGPDEGDRFGGFSFRFTPTILEELGTLLERVLSGNDRRHWKLHGERFDLDELRARDFRRACRETGINPAEESRFLSPYLLPVPVRAADDTLAALAREGYATVVRLPFNGPEGREKTVACLAELDSDALLFLEGMETLHVDDESGAPRTIRRNAKSKHGRRTIVTLSDEKTAARRFWVWQQTIGGEQDLGGRDAIQQAASGLPGRWPEMTEGKVAVAVQLGPEPLRGRHFIFLPTDLENDTGAHFNAPFYGDMSRTKVDFDEPLNAFLLERLARLASDVIRNELAGRGSDEARAIVDLLAGPDADLNPVWVEKLRPTLGDTALFHTARGWKTATAVRTVPVVREARVLKPSVLRRHAAFAALEPKLDSRTPQAAAMVEALGGIAEPTESERAETVENVAAAARNRLDWEQFWVEVEHLLPDARALQGRSVLLCEDGVLRGRDPKVRVFFPRALPGDDEQPSEPGVQVPRTLRRRIAFLSKKVALRRKNEAGRWESSRPRKYLEPLVDEYGVETIIKGVLVPALPPDHVPLESTKGRWCRDILDFAVRLVHTAREDSSLVPLLGRLRLPCRGGWFPARETTFGPGWPDMLGEDLLKYLEGAATDDARYLEDRLLVAPQSPYFAGHGEILREWLEPQLGVTSGLKPIPVPDAWPAVFWMGGHLVQLPATAPPFVSDQHWRKYVAAREGAFDPPFAGSFQYRLAGVCYLAGLQAFDKLDAVARRSLTAVLMHSLPRWEPDWKESRIRKIGGQSFETSIPSLLHDLLTRLDWITDEEEGSISPGDRWLVPATVERTQRHQFRHLRPLSPEVTKTTLREPKLVEALASLGMPVLDFTKRARNARLLEALGLAIQDDRIDPSNWSIFLGQVRDAWNVFYPLDAQTLPERLIIMRGGQHLAYVKPSSADPVFIPDAGPPTKLEHFAGLPVVLIGPQDGMRLLPLLRDRFGESIRALSSLRLQAWVGGEPYSPAPAPERLVSSALAWVGPFALTVAAFGGPQQYGTRTDRFKKAVVTLRSMNLERVSDLRVCLVGVPGEEPRPQSAFYDPDTRTLLYDDGSTAFLEGLAGPLQQVLERSDLMTSLVLAFSKVGEDLEPDHDRQVAALGALQIPEVNFAEVRQLFTGDLSWTIERARPAIVLLAPVFDLATLSEIDSIDALAATLEPHLTSFGATELIELARDAREDSELGRKLFERVGKLAELSAWNDAIERVGPPYRPAENREFKQEFDDHRREALTPLRALARRVARAADDPALFLSLTTPLLTRRPPEELGRRYWTLPFHEALRVLLVDFVGMDDAASLLTAIDGATDATELAAALAREDPLIEPTRDPTELHRENVERCRRRLEELRTAALVFCNRSGVPAGTFLNDADAAFHTVQRELDGGMGFIDVLDETRVLALLATKLSHEPSHARFWEVVGESDSVHAVVKRLGITPEDQLGIARIVEKARDQARRAARLIDVCGEPFDGEAANLGTLVAHLERCISDDHLPAMDPRNVSRLEKLPPAGRNGRQGSGDIGARGDRHQRPTEEKLRLIGLAGEIFAYRMLKKHYGDAMTPSAWVSTNSQYCFPANPGDDSLGYDFCVTKRKRTFYVEVKATTRQDELFELGSSEIRWAVECARRERGYRILHIHNVLSSAPVAHFLPNPFETRNKDLFRTDESGLLIRYRTPRQV